MASKRTPILYLAPWVDLGGSDKGTIDWFKHIDRTRWAPSLITTQPSSNRWLHQVEPYAAELWALPDLMPGAGFPGFILGFIESRGVEVVHVMNSRIAYDLMPDMTCLRRPPSIVVQFHAEEPDRAGYVRYAAARYGNLVDAFSVTSHQLAAAMRDYDVAGSRVHVIHSGVDALDEFDPARVEPFADLPGTGPHVLWPGRLVEQKDPMLTLDVLRLLRDRGVQLTLHVVGDGELAPAVQARARELGVDGMIAWHPPSLQMARWYRSCDLLLMTSVFEGVPYVIYEALAMGVPVVAPALPGNVEFMDADSGVLVDPRDDAEQYARAVAGLLADGERRRTLGERSRERMLRDFSLGEMAERHERLYDAVRGPGLAADRARAEAIAAAPAAPERPPAPLRLSRDPAPERSVAVIVPCYQHGRFLPDCIASIRAQTLPAAQIVVVDDRSEDPETSAALAELDAAPDVTVIRQAVNRGPSAARNRALEQVTASYVLPLDADDLLLPGALEAMTAQLEAAPDDVGFVYPNPQHFGNRNDYVEVPGYNLHLLLEGNYCPATTLFDRRVFAAGVAYDEAIVFGHEDWDLVLQLAERGVHGEVAHGPTFKYRRRGFSRVNAVEYGPQSFQDEVERRHPALYAPEARMRIKGEWAPALSVVLLDDAGEAWDAELAAGLTAQSCADFEVLAARPLELPGVHVVVRDGGDADWLAPTVAAARGRWVLVAAPGAASAFGRRSFAESLLRAFWENEAAAGVVLTSVPEQRLAAFSQIGRRGTAPPAAVAWERPPGAPLDAEVVPGLTGSAIGDLVMAVQLLGPVQWRSLPLPSPVPDGVQPAGRAVEAIR